jgi:hypothetical protein
VDLLAGLQINQRPPPVVALPASAVKLGGPIFRQGPLFRMGSIAWRLLLSQ